MCVGGGGGGELMHMLLNGERVRISEGFFPVNCDFKSKFKLVNL